MIALRVKFLFWKYKGSKDQNYIQASPWISDNTLFHITHITKLEKWLQVKYGYFQDFSYLKASDLYFFNFLTFVALERCLELTVWVIFWSGVNQQFFEISFSNLFTQVFFGQKSPWKTIFFINGLYNASSLEAFMQQCKSIRIPWKCHQTQLYT